MNKLLFLVCAATTTFAVACSGSDSSTVAGGDASTGADGSASDASAGDGSTGTDGASGTDGGAHDASTPDGSTSHDGGITCGNTTCTGADICCGTIADGGSSATFTCAPSCPDGGVTIACSGPAQCNTAKPYCCATASWGAGTPPACPYQSATAECTSTCTTQIPQQCPGMSTARLCQAKADCAGDSQNPDCCTFTQGGNTATFCVSTFASAGATSCAR